MINNKQNKVRLLSIAFVTTIALISLIATTAFEVTGVSYLAYVIKHSGSHLLFVIPLLFTASVALLLLNTIPIFFGMMVQKGSVILFLAAIFQLGILWHHATTNALTWEVGSFLVMNALFYAVTAYRTFKREMPRWAHKLKGRQKTEISKNRDPRP